jgi:glutamine cyclotransferase
MSIFSLVAFNLNSSIIKYLPEHLKDIGNEFTFSQENDKCLLTGKNWL